MFATGVSEMVLIVADVPAAARFYRDVVGLAPFTEPDDQWAWFWTGKPGSSTRLALHMGPLLFEEHSPRPMARRWGQIHFALEVPRERLTDAVDHLRTNRVQVHGPVRLDWMNADAYYFYDPDANLVEFWSPGAAARMVEVKATVGAAADATAAPAGPPGGS